MPHYKTYFDTWKFENADQWARHEAEGNCYYGYIDKYDDEWRRVSKERNYDILFLAFEEIVRLVPISLAFAIYVNKLRNKKKSINQIADFLGIESFDMSKVIEESSVKNTMERRRKKFAKAGVPFREVVCYRKGEIGSWREELSDETKELFLKKYPYLQA